MEQLIPIAYIIYAYVQAVLVCRFAPGMKGDVLAVIVVTLMAPIVSGLILLNLFVATTRFLAGGKFNE